MLAANLLPAVSARTEEDLQFYGPCWADSSGRDGKGGVSIVTSGNDHKFLLRDGACKEKIDSKTLGDHPDWVAYDGEDSGKCLSYEFTWMTKASSSPPIP